MPNPTHHYTFDTLGATVADAGSDPVLLNLSGYSSAAARVGVGAVGFPGSGSAEVTTDALIDFSGPFTYCAWYRVDHLVTRILAVLRYPNGPSNAERELSAESVQSLAEWTHVTVTREGLSLLLYVNGVLASASVVNPAWGDPVGLALVAIDRFSDAGHCSMDDARVYDAALTIEEINELLTAMPAPPTIYYELNGINLKSFGLYVSKSSGLYDRPDRKDPFTAEWDDYHGNFPDLSLPLFGIREIILECFILGESENDIAIKLAAFLEELHQPGTQRLTMYGANKPFFFEVWCKDSIASQRVTSQPGGYSRTLTLKLIEPQPIKRVLRFQFDQGEAAVATFTLTSKKMLTVFWGDGLKSHNVYGTALVVNHTYAAPGEYFIVIAGNIEQVTGFTTNAEVLWDRL